MKELGGELKRLIMDSMQFSILGLPDHGQFYGKGLAEKVYEIHKRGIRSGE